VRTQLFPFQEKALADLHTAIQDAHILWRDNKPQVISFTAPTGAGKTIIMTALFEDIIFGHAFGAAEPDSVFVWLSDMPELNMQTLLKIESQSDKFRPRNVDIVDSSFDAEYFVGGNIYFLNTQKLGSDKLLTQKSDSRQYTIWETLANTAKRQPKSFYVVIDEAHRGTTSSQQENKAQSIMQKFVKGSREDGLPVMPLVIGVTATPQRFQRLIADTASVIQKVVVPPEDVRESGLLKDRIIIRYPDIAINADMTLFKEAVKDWRDKCDRWAEYCEREEITDAVRPIFVVQVEDISEHGRGSTETDLAECINIIEGALGRKLQWMEAVHTFNGLGTVTVGDVDIRNVDASYIEEDEKAMVVFFKMNLSTGWDCPRAETMMSFRSATDYTYIAQLLGRMIRTPLARRVESDADLNNVGLFLPFFNKETVKKVVDALSEGETVVPVEAGSHKELITLKRNPEFADIFNNFNLVTYRIDSARKQPALRRLMALARALMQDMIDEDCRKNTLKKILDVFDKELAALKESGEFDKRAADLTGLMLRTLTIDYIGDAGNPTDGSTEIIPLSDSDLKKLFNRAGKILGDGLHMDYWNNHVRRDWDDIKREVIVLANDNNAMERVEKFADAEFYELYDKHQTDFRTLKEERKNTYTKLAQTSATPIPLNWQLPETIDFTVDESAKVYDRHLYIPVGGGKFKVNLNSWESALVKEELENGAVAWLRNLDRKKWSLEIPYEDDGQQKPMFPDLIVVRKVKNQYLFDILEPHDPSRKDNWPKAVGLARFADNHCDMFGRIQLIRRAKGPDKREHFYRLDMGKVNIRNKVRGITSNEMLDRIFEENAETGN